MGTGGRAGKKKVKRRDRMHARIVVRGKKIKVNKKLSD